MGGIRTNDGRCAEVVEVSDEAAKMVHRGTGSTQSALGAVILKSPKQNVIQLGAKPLPSIPVESPLQNFAQTIELANID